MKKICTSLFLVVVCFNFCSAQKLIGIISIASTRTIDPTVHYVLLKASATFKQQERTIDEAIEDVLKNTPGAVYLQNVRIFQQSVVFSVTGDVWGIAVENPDFNGFHKGDKVQWAKAKIIYSGIITELTDAKECTIKSDKDGSTIKLEYTRLTKMP